MRRKKQHLSVANKYLRDERTVPRLAALFQMCAYVLDAEGDEEFQFFKNLTMSFFGSDPNSIRWKNSDDPPSTETHLSRRDAEATAKAKEVFSAILNMEAPNG